MSDVVRWVMEFGSFAKDFPWLMVIVALMPFALLAWRFRVYPTALLSGLLLISLLLSTLVPWASPVVFLVLFLDVIFFGVACVDLFLLPRKSDFRAERQMQRAASIGAKHKIEVSIDYSGSWFAAMEVREDSPMGFEVEPAVHQVRLPARKRAILHHQMQPTKRGAYQLQFVYLRLFSLLRFWQRVVVLPCQSELNVYPDMKQVAEYAILARTNRLSLIGVRKSRRIGQDSDFERLRDYTPDDNYKFIDWRSTARRNRLTVKDFQSDQSQRVMFLLDSGRMMTNQYNGLSLLDYSLNSALMLSYVALQQGDSVGMVTFSDRVHSYVPPRSGKSQMNQLLHAGFDRFPSLVESRFDEAFLHLSTNLRKRSLVVLITNVIDQVNADQIVSYMTNLQKRHLPLLVLLRDHRMFDFADNPATSPDVLYRSAAAAQILCWRADVLKRLELQGILAVDAFPEQMTSPLINRYLEVKAKHML